MLLPPTASTLGATRLLQLPHLASTASIQLSREGQGWQLARWTGSGPL